VPQLLHLDSSADLSGSVSRSLTARFAAGWSALSPGHDIVRRDLHADMLPHLPTNVLHWAPHLRTETETVPADAEDLQNRLIAELQAADVVLIGAPMYNWSVPSTLKAWIDYIHVPGTTTPFDTATQPFAGKPAVVVSSRGGQYGPGTPDEADDHQVPGLQRVLRVALGMEVHLVIADLTLAPRVAALAPLVAEGAERMARAEATIDELVIQLGG